MSGRGPRAWLTWIPPVVVAVVVLVALQLTGGDGEDVAVTSTSAATSVASGDSSTTTRPTTPATDTPTTPTTGFADRVPTLPAEVFDYSTELPQHWFVNGLGDPRNAPMVEFDSTPPDAPVTDEGATLGRVLFYDVNLSINRTVRCASCHVQSNSFTDPLTFSQGVGGFLTRRNSMPLANAGFNASARFLWDEASVDLEEQMITPFIDPREMGLTEQLLIERVVEADYYGPLFVDAFGDTDVTIDRVSAALAQFIRAMVSVDAPYDEGRAMVSSPLDPFPNFTDEENRGKEIFYTPIEVGGGGCSGCHVSEGQVNTAEGLNSNGIDPPFGESIVPDLGAFEVTGDIADVGRFRVPSLRNVEVTGPYMHDGRLRSLDDVVEHYNSGILPHENLSTLLLDDAGNPVRLGLDDADKSALVAFLETLTDETFLRDERFSEPFRSG